MTGKTNSRPFPRTSPATDKAYAHIRRKIASGELSAGQPVSEIALAQELRISRTPIREALWQLAGEGILKQSPNRPAVVVKLTRNDIIELYELREALEAFAIDKVARQPLQQEMLDKLQSLADSILTLKAELDRSGKFEADEEQMRRFLGWDLALHTQLMRLARNDRVIKVVNETRVLIRIFAIRRHGYTGARLEEVHREHSEVVRAIREQDSEGAVRAINHHIHLSQIERLDDFDHWEIESSLSETIPGGARLESALQPDK